MKLTYERSKLHSFSGVIGVDEVGRGCLAGSVVAAAVVFPAEFFFQKKYAPWVKSVNDSKQLSGKLREELAEKIFSLSFMCTLAEVNEQIIDKINIHNATLLAMKNAVTKIFTKASSETPKNFLIAVDGKFTIPELAEEQAAIVGGDAKVFSIAAASIAAKVYRDKLLTKLHVDYPEYNFAKNKGYGTRKHIEAIKTYGLTPLHRRSFCQNFIQQVTLSE